MGVPVKEIPQFCDSFFDKKVSLNVRPKRPFCDFKSVLRLGSAAVETKWRQDTQNNDTQHNNILLNDTQHKGLKGDTQHE